MLIITYYWPPSGGVGVQRWLKFSKYLPDYNWSPIIYTPSNPEFDLKDENLDKDLPGNIKVIRRPILEPFRLYKNLTGRKANSQQGIVSDQSRPSIFKKLMIWLRGNLFVPDPRVLWVRPSVRFLIDFVKTEKIDLVVTTGPPHSMHLIGLGLKKKLGAKWVADFRDPWSDWDLLPRLRTSAWAMERHRKKEKSVFENCDGLLTVTPTLGELYKSRCKNVGVVTNGFDGEVFQDSITPEKFVISHVGMLNEIKNPSTLWKILEEMVEEDPQFGVDLQIRLAGPVSSYVVESISQGPLANNFEYMGYVSHQKVYDLYRNSTLLLLLMNKTDNAKWIIHAKLFEYLQVQKPVLALGSKETDANNILKDVGADQFIDFEDHQSIKHTIQKYYDRFLNKKLEVRFKGVEKYSRKRLTGELAQYLSRVVEG